MSAPDSRSPGGDRRVASKRRDVLRCSWISKTRLLKNRNTTTVINARELTAAKFTTTKKLDTQFGMLPLREDDKKKLA